MRAILTIVFAVIFLWAAAFGIFLVSMFLPPSSPDKKADALIVLTGGNNRVERGFTLLAEDAAPVLFISGVGEKVTLSEMLAAHSTAEVRQHILENQPDIVFDYDASSTQTNAIEAADFVRERGYHTIRLVTAHYHMPRSLIEFRTALPEVVILREPVVPESFTHGTWWNDEASRRLIIQEFHKYLAASGRTLFERS